MPNLVRIRPRGASGQIGKIYHFFTFFLYIYIYIYFFFFNSPTGHTPQWVLTRDGSKDAFSPKEVPFGVKNKLKLTLNPISCPPKVKFWQKSGLRKFLAENA